MQWINARRVTLSLLSCLLLSAALLIYGCSMASYPASKQPNIPTGSGQGGSFTGQKLAAKRASESPRAAAPAGSLPSLDEEVWIIARDQTQQSKQPEQANQQAKATDKIPGSGVMMTRRDKDGETKQVPLPLKRTDVDGEVEGYIASVNVRQRFHNPYSEKIEAVYVFPLPQNAAVNEFVMTIGDRKIRGIIRKKEEAKRLYKKAKQQGYRASLLTQQRPNVFTQKVANIEPDKQIDVDIRYFNTLQYRDGWYHFTFPMVVGPRYNPPGQSDGIGAVPRGQRGPSGQDTEVAYLKPNEKSRHRVHLNLDIHAGVPIEAIECTSHPDQASVRRPGDERAKIKLPDDGVRANHDFTVRWRVAGDRLKANLVKHQPEEGEDGYFALTLYPPQELASLPRQPLEMVFVLDTSGSMQGRPLTQAKAAVDHALGKLGPRDSFQVIRFSDDASTFGSAPVRATAENIDRARDYVADLTGGGGTQMIEGLKTALEFDHEPERLRFVCFMTDGYIGNENQILGALHDRLGATRVFSFGVGESPNRYLMNRMAKLGRGAVAYLPLDAQAPRVMNRFYRRVRRPALTDLNIDWGRWDVEGVHPTRVPDLFVGRAVTLIGRIHGNAAADNTIRVKGEAGDRTLQVNIEPEPRADSHASKALPAVWARRQIAELYDRSTYQSSDELAPRIQQIALDHSLMSAYTAFVAVDSTERTAGKQGTSVRQAVPTPEGVKYDTTVPEK
jgi:Ca-activated chloride channel family protein